MKKSLFLVTAIAVLILSSCKKTYTCDCTSTIEMSSYDPYTYEPTVDVSKGTSSTSFVSTKADAKAACDGYAQNTSTAGYKQSTTCVLK